MNTTALTAIAPPATATIQLGTRTAAGPVPDERFADELRRTLTERSGAPAERATTVRERATSVDSDRSQAQDTASADRVIDRRGDPALERVAKRGSEQSTGAEATPVPDERSPDHETTDGDGAHDDLTSMVAALLATTAQITSPAQAAPAQTRAFGDLDAMATIELPATALTSTALPLGLVSATTPPATTPPVGLAAGAAPAAGLSSATAPAAGLSSATAPAAGLSSATAPAAGLSSATVPAPTAPALGGAVASIGAPGEATEITAPAAETVGVHSDGARPPIATPAGPTDTQAAPTAERSGGAPTDLTGEVMVGSRPTLDSGSHLPSDDTEGSRASRGIDDAASPVPSMTTAEPDPEVSESADANRRSAPSGGASAAPVTHSGASATGPLGTAPADVSATIDLRAQSAAQTASIASNALHASAGAPVTDTVTPARIAQVIAPELTRMRGTSTNRTIEIRLDPPDLGSVDLEIRSSGSAITIIARTDSPDAMAAVIRQREQIEATLRTLGMDLAGFDVTAGDSRRDHAENGRSGASNPAAGSRGTESVEESLANPLPTITEGSVFL